MQTCQNIQKLAITANFDIWNWHAEICLRIVYLLLLIVSETILGDRWSEAGTGRSNSSHSLERGTLTGQDRKIVTKLGILLYRGYLVNILWTFQERVFAWKSCQHEIKNQNAIGPKNLVTSSQPKVTK